MQSLILASGNPNKITEIGAILKDKPIEIFTMASRGITEEIPETGTTLYKNSLLKAEYVYNRLGGNVMAEDTGLEVTALNGEPGVYSARYAGKHKDANANMDLLLSKLASHGDRSAQFKTVVTLFWNDLPYQFVGTASGRIDLKKSGTGGFGYDPIFIPDGFEKSFACMVAEDKNQISHRRHAIQYVSDFLIGELA